MKLKYIKLFEGLFDDDEILDDRSFTDDESLNRVFYEASSDNMDDLIVDVKYALSEYMNSHVSDMNVEFSQDKFTVVYHKYDHDKIIIKYFDAETYDFTFQLRCEFTMSNYEESVLAFKYSEKNMDPVEKVKLTVRDRLERIIHSGLLYSKRDSLSNGNTSINAPNSDKLIYYPTLTFIGIRFVSMNEEMIKAIKI
jgi:hypothetical protein